MANDARHHPSALRNRGPILEVLQDVLADKSAKEGHVLEIGSGSGCHAEHFAPNFPKLQWQPSEYVQEGNTSVLKDIDEVTSSIPNVRRAVALDASAAWADWPSQVREFEGQFTAVYLSNITHISPWKVTCGIVAGASEALENGGLLIIYGPFKVNGEFTTESNADFDKSLRSRNPEWGYRDIDEICAEAKKNGLQFEGKREMPANNFLLTFSKTK